jgi:hypothetical protein
MPTALQNLLAAIDGATGPAGFVINSLAGQSTSNVSNIGSKLVLGGSIIGATKVASDAGAIEKFFLANLPKEAAAASLTYNIPRILGVLSPSSSKASPLKTRRKTAKRRKTIRHHVKHKKAK